MTTNQSEKGAPKLTPAKVRYLRAFIDGTDLRKFNHGSCGRAVMRKQLVAMGMLERLPVAGTGSARYRITDAGRAALRGAS